MRNGYVYILINSSMPGLVKIGKTLRDSQIRAKKLFTTGIPTPFEVAFEVFSEDYDALEKNMHDTLSHYRVSNNREFFRYPLKECIELLINLNTSQSSDEANFSSISIFHQLKSKYGSWIDPKLIDIRIIQTSDIVWLETTIEKEIGSYLRDLFIHRSDLGFIIDDKDLFFSPDSNIIENARRFIDEFDVISIINTTDIFHSEACSDIYKKYRSQHL
ncbi:GIY-YIG nuclease family protein [Photorhabdus heterorhabditis]|uniref:GIY-YIG nuclease family protein n=1 Tax=Photorhabdus heterorhabditis TaxID=880156 RepID=UPI001562E9EF|nr:GIY-YIG nuclease family protein [Photorhabdus heterorhabditis]NRN28636.1 GIY-YIG nuclease family protein [Photorhabdus heterorhabditis subsp. aluminescens]